MALSSAIFAALAAIASLQAGHHINEALISQLHASDNWAYYQAKGIKGNILASRLELLAALGKPASAAENNAEAKSVEKYTKEQEEIKAEATRLEEDRTHHLEHHEKLATAVTMFQICIAVSAISVLTGRRTFWWVSLVFGAIGVYYLLVGPFYLTTLLTRQRTHSFVTLQSSGGVHLSVAIRRLGGTPLRRVHRGTPHPPADPTERVPPSKTTPTSTPLKFPFPYVHNPCWANFAF